MASYNKVILVGNLTRDPEMRFTQGGAGVCNFALAINDSYKDAQGNKVENTTFVDVTLWKRLAEIAAQYLRKGSPCLIEGRLKQDRWEKDGQKFSKLTVTGTSMQMLGSKQDGGPRDQPPPQQAPPATTNQPPAQEEADEEIPF